MTRDEIIEATTEAIAASDHLAAHLERLAVRLDDSFPIQPALLAQWGDDPRERLHALLRMFEQLYDLTGRKLLRGLLLIANETLSGMSAQNQARRVEALGGLPNADRWLELGATRNALVHDYPTDPVAQAQRANRAWKDLPDLIAATRAIIAYLRAEGL